MSSPFITVSLMMPLICDGPTPLNCEPKQTIFSEESIHSDKRDPIKMQTNCANLLCKIIRKTGPPFAEKSPQHLNGQQSSPVLDDTPADFGGLSRPFAIGHQKIHRQICTMSDVLSLLFCHQYFMGPSYKFCTVNLLDSHLNVQPSEL
ncbi:hypothetical protein STEG23_018840, partial [Scotinomys teguina]